MVATCIWANKTNATCLSTKRSKKHLVFYFLLFTFSCLSMRNLSIYLVVVLASVLLPFRAQAQEPGTIVTIAGGGTEEGENIPATDVGLDLPLGISLDAQGNIFIADTENHRIRRVDITTGNITTVAGT
ncbi:MAG: hypothetical protein HN521_02210, partial [Candidatus Latescibacteria bacterium]|nr:hypothetical protein [Candidatus Latescibacterota bacterium]